MKPQGQRYYMIDMDRPVHIQDHAGETIHRYLDEPFWRNAQGVPIPAPEQIPSN